MIEQFHFLRPWWLLALPALASLLWLLRRRGQDSGNWRAVIDPHLLPHLLAVDAGTNRDRVSWALTLAAAIAIIALAGPTWEKRSQAAYMQPSALVVVLDLSRSMNATDIRPSRLARARHKIVDILNTRKEGQTALVVYAADAFAVTPLTSDTDTILALLPDLETGLMPAQGSRADRAFERALELFTNSGVAYGDVLLVSDGFSEREIDGLEALLDQHTGHRVSVLAIGTAEGGPIPMKNGGFLKDRAGSIVIPAMNTENMLRITEYGNGVFTSLSNDDEDINTLSDLIETSADEREALLSDSSAQQWRELGPSLLLLVLPLAALAFRRGLLWMLPLVIVLLPPDARALEWKDLWSNSDQRALRLFKQGEHAAAASMFDDDDWRASASYRAGDFAAAAEQWQRLDGENASYNYANSLAQLGRYEDALAAYDVLLQQNPVHADAIYNRQAIADWLEQQQKSAGQSQQDESSEQAEGDQSQQTDGGGTQAQDDGEKAESGEQTSENGQSQSESAMQDSANPEGQQDEQSMQEQQARGQPGEQEATDTGAAETDAATTSLDQQMSEQAAEQWLRKIPDDPGGLLRRKFVYQYRNRGGVDNEEQTW